MVYPSDILTKHRPALIGLLLALLAFGLGWCSKRPDVAHVYEGRPESATRIERRVDTVVRVMPRSPVRVSISTAGQPVGGEVAHVDTVFLPDGTAAADSTVEQSFVVAVDTVTGRDTVRGQIEVIARARDGPISLPHLRTALQVMTVPDTIRLEERTVVVETERVVHVRPTMWERAGWAGIGALCGATAVAIIVLATDNK